MTGLTLFIHGFPGFFLWIRTPKTHRFSSTFHKFSKLLRIIARNRGFKPNFLSKRQFFAEHQIRTALLKRFSSPIVIPNINIIIITSKDLVWYSNLKSKFYNEIFLFFPSC